MKQIIIGKGLTVAVIILFIGLAIQPSINANTKQSEFVEITTKVYGLNGGKHTVKLTQQEADEVKEIFNSIREKLNNTESKEESEEIFKEAVVELDRYGLLGGLSVKQAQKLVIGGYQNSRAGKFLEKIGNRYEYMSDNNSNALCLIAGETINTFVFGPSTILRVLLMLPLYITSWFFVISCDFLRLLGLERLSNFLWHIGCFVDHFFMI